MVSVNAIHERQQLGPRADRSGTSIETFKPPKASSLRKWLKRYEVSGNQVKALIPKTNVKKPSTGPSLSIQVEAIIALGLNLYQSTQRPTQMRTVKHIQTAVRDQNRVRAQEGLALLNIPGETSIKRRIRKLDKYQTACKRFGVKYANDKFSLFDGGLDLLYPLERIEIDEWKIDLISILAQSGIDLNLSLEEIKG